MWRIAQASHPERPLARGYALVTDRSGRVMMSAEAARAARLLTLRFGDGEVDASTGETVERPKRTPHKDAKGDQPKLL